eukprot:2290423-Rhodomonas_salina.1
MEGIEQPEADFWDETESGLAAINLDSHEGEVSRSKTRWCASGDIGRGHLEPTVIRLIIICFLLVLYAIHSYAERYDYYVYFRLAIHYEQCM